MTSRFLLASLAAGAGLILFPAPGRAEDDPVQVHYAGYAHGLNLFDLDLAANLRDQSYRLQLSFALTGVLGALFHAHGTTIVEGAFSGPHAVPRLASATGEFGGEPHVMQIQWQNGMPQILQMLPPPELEREPVPRAAQADTIDTLSAIAGLLHTVNVAGTCDGMARTFDGERLSEFSARTVGPEMLPATPRSTFKGEALRCDVTGRMIGGFMHDADARQRKPKQGTVWFARPQPGQKLAPVRIAFYSEGDLVATLYVADPPKPAP